MRKAFAILGASWMITACGDDDKSDESGAKGSYSFRADASVILESTEASLDELSLSAENPPMCEDNLCFTPTSLTGKYFGAGLMIQSSGSGMLAYFGQDSWSETSGSSPTYDFDFSNPETNSNVLVCCSGQGDLGSENTYISDVVYMFAYVDATFEIPIDSGAHGDALGEHTIRFVFADDAVADAKRGDMLYLDGDAFKWMESSGDLSESRPAEPIMMNAGVADWENPFGSSGNQSIPMLSTSVNPPASGGQFQVSETELKTAGRTYAFDFNMTGFIAFPTLMKADIGMLESRKALLSKIHVQGMPHSSYQMGDAGDTTVTVTGP